jgi:hypothetical protein
MTRNK